MARMSLGTYVFERNPHVDTPPDLVAPERKTAWVDTYSGGAFFSWGLTVAGSEIELQFGHIPDSVYQNLLALYVADEPVVFNPKQGDDKTYNVEITRLTGKFHLKLGDNSSNVWRKDVTMAIRILSEVVA